MNIELVVKIHRLTIYENSWNNEFSTKSYLNRVLPISTNYFQTYKFDSYLISMRQFILEENPVPWCINASFFFRMMELIFLLENFTHKSQYSGKLIQNVTLEVVSGSIEYFVMKYISFSS